MFEDDATFRMALIVRDIERELEADFAARREIEQTEEFDEAWAVEAARKAQP